MPYHTTSHEDRLHTARRRRMLEDTAIQAAGGGVLIALSEGLADDTWDAEVRHPSGAILTMVLDPALGTVELRSRAAERLAVA